MRDDPARDSRRRPDTGTTIPLSIDSLIAAVQSYRASGDIRKPTASQRLKELRAAKQLLMRRKIAAAKQRLSRRFLKLVKPRAISNRAVTRLTALTKALIASLTPGTTLLSVGEPDE